MIKFFRRIRQKLLSENKLSKYLLYAIGEILLVVIGILIALEINNNNEAKVNKERFLGVLQEIETDLFNDLSKGQRVLRKGEEKDSLYRKIINGELTATDYQHNEDYSLFWLGLTYDPYEYQKSGFARFENFSGILPKEYEQVSEYISNHYNVVCATFEDSHNNMIQNIAERHEYMSLNYPWFSQMHNEARTEEIINFYLNDPIYKNWIFQSYQFSMGNNTSMTIMQNSVFRLLIMIADIQDEEVPYAQYFKEYLGQQLTPSEKEVAGTYLRGETGRTFELKIKAGFLMYDGANLMKKIDTDKYQNAEFPDWFYETIRDEEGRITEFLMKDTGNNRVLKCPRME